MYIYSCLNKYKNLLRNITNGYYMFHEMYLKKNEKMILNFLKPQLNSILISEIIRIPAHCKMKEI